MRALVQISIALLTSSRQRSIALWASRFSMFSQAETSPSTCDVAGIFMAHKNFTLPNKRHKMGLYNMVVNWMVWLYNDNSTINGWWEWNNKKYVTQFTALFKNNIHFCLLDHEQITVKFSEQDIKFLFHKMHMKTPSAKYFFRPQCVKLMTNRC